MQPTDFFFFFYSVTVFENIKFPFSYIHHSFTLENDENFSLTDLIPVVTGLTTVP